MKKFLFLELFLKFKMKKKDEHIFLIIPKISKIEKKKKFWVLWRTKENKNEKEKQKLRQLH
jgi:hypothetical protein